MNLKITSIVLLGIFLAIVFFYIIMNWYPSNFDPIFIWTEHVKNKSDNPKILLLGSSHTGVLNTDHIQKYVISNGLEHEVYNLAIPSDYPTRRAETIGHISELNPDIILYGIEIRMFEGQPAVKQEQITALQITPIDNIMPNTKEFFEDLFFPLINNDFFSKIPKSPKIVTLQTIKHFAYDSNTTMELDIFSNRPFFNIERKIAPIIDLEDLKKDWEKKTPKNFVMDPDNNREFNELKELIKELKNKNIKVVIFATPKSSVYLDWLTVENKIIFEQMLKEIEDSGTRVYGKYDMYENYNIWTNVDHVTENELGTIYSEDIAKIIVSEIKE